MVVGMYTVQCNMQQLQGLLVNSYLSTVESSSLAGLSFHEKQKGLVKFWY